MSLRIRITRAGPLVTVQDSGRAGCLKFGVSASGPMDRAAWLRAGAMVDGAGSSGLEFTRAGLAFELISGMTEAAFAGAAFALRINAKSQKWPWHGVLKAGDKVDITPGASGNYGYLRFAADIDLPVLMGSRATNTIVGLGGLNGRALRPGDELDLVAAQNGERGSSPSADADVAGPMRFVWGLHADIFPADIRERFVSSAFVVSPRLDRMGVRLDDLENVFGDMEMLSLVSDSVVPGDVQILGDGTPIVLMRDHQPTGGYPRIATVISADLDRFAQMRPGVEVRFEPVSVGHAQKLLKARTA